MSSICIDRTDEKEFLKNILGYKDAFTTLRYRGSEHGWMGKDFHARCDGKKPTITLFKLKNGSCIGGFTTS